jgi:hypothetical protein
MHRGDCCIRRHHDGGEGPLPLTGVRIFPVLPDRGDGERFAVGAFDHVQLALGVLLVKRIDRHHAAALAIGVAEDRLVGDCLRPRIHGWMPGRVSASRGINPQVR